MSFSEWKEARLGDFISIKHGYAFDGKAFSEERLGRPIIVNIGNFDYSGGFRFDRTKVRECVGDYPQEYRLEPGDVLVAMTCQTSGGEILGVPGMVPCDGNIYLHNQRLGKVIIKKPDEINISYVYYLCLWDVFKRELFVTASGTKILHTAPNRIENFRCLFPSIKEQKFISSLLSSLDEKIETNNQINKKLEEMAQAIFKQWFVDFEFPNQDGEPYKSSGGEMVQSELGMIPKSWEVKSLDGIADYLNGLAMQKFRPSEGEEGLPVLKIKELRQGFTDVNSDACSSTIVKQYIINDGDVIFSWSGSLLVDIWCGGKCGLNQHLFKVTSSKYEKWFYYYWTKQHLDKFIGIAEDKATTMGHIKRNDLVSSLVVVPNYKIFNKIDKILKLLLDRMIKARIESRKLKEVRDNLLPKLMLGEIRVPTR